MGYEYKPADDLIAERRYFNKGPQEHHRHLHMVELGGDFWRRHLAFRDYLRTHPDTAQQYAALKRDLALRFPDDSMAYTGAKTDFIQSVEALAMAERERVDLAVRVIVFMLGLYVVVRTLYSAMQDLRAAAWRQHTPARWVFGSMRRLFDLRLRWARTYERRDAILALYAPISLMALPFEWLLLVLLGYTGMYWATGAESLSQAFLISGSSLFTLGSVQASGAGSAILEFSEAAIGLVLVALFIAYLPAIYAAFARREREVAMLEVRAGSPPSAVEMINRYHRIHGLEQFSGVADVGGVVR